MFACCRRINILTAAVITKSMAVTEAMPVPKYDQQRWETYPFPSDKSNLIDDPPFICGENDSFMLFLVQSILILAGSAYLIQALYQLYQFYTLNKERMHLICQFCSSPEQRSNGVYLYARVASPDKDCIIFVDALPMDSAITSLINKPSIVRVCLSQGLMTRELHMTWTGDLQFLINNVTRPITLLSVLKLNLRLARKVEAILASQGTITYELLTKVKGQSTYDTLDNTFPEAADVIGQSSSTAVDLLGDEVHHEFDYIQLQSTH